MTTQDREIRVVYTNGTGAWWFIAILLLIVLAVGGFYLYNTGAFADGNNVNVTIDVPDDIIPAASGQ